KSNQSLTTECLYCYFTALSEMLPNQESFYTTHRYRLLMRYPAQPDFCHERYENESSATRGEENG
ncbi:hypothetical protein, partial [Escherichia coli]|uniref:hypothetical protein n=1 Tax=Escherichia coli TaxID=562 RepID=UPI001BCC9742